MKKIIGWVIGLSVWGVIVVGGHLVLDWAGVPDRETSASLLGLTVFSVVVAIVVGFCIVEGWKEPAEGYGKHAAVNTRAQVRGMVVGSFVFTFLTIPLDLTINPHGRWWESIVYVVVMLIAFGIAFVVGQFFWWRRMKVAGLLSKVQDGGIR